MNLKGMDLKFLKLVPGTAGSLLDSLEPLLLKGCMQDLVDFTTKFGLPGSSCRRIFLGKSDTDQTPAHKTAQVFNSLLSPVFVVGALVAQAYRKDLFGFHPGNATTHKDRLLFLENGGSKYVVHLVRDWTTLPQETRQVLPGGITIVIHALGRLTEEGTTLVNHLTCW